MMIVADEKPIPNKVCKLCGSQGTLVKKGIDADDHDAIVVKCTACKKMYTLEKETK